jgi:hypothetical protein
MRFINRLFEASPGIITPVFAKAPSLVSNRSPAFLCPASGPWQAKQVSDRIGLISRLKSMGACFLSCATTAQQAASAIIPIVDAVILCKCSPQGCAKN